MISREPNGQLRAKIRGGSKETMLLAQHMWHGGWREELEPSVYWAKFLELIGKQYYRFQVWADGEKSWDELEGEIKSIAAVEGTPKGK